jgi:hypothetical protein
MAKGTAILLAYGASLDEVIGSVRVKYAPQRATAAGWHGQAVVNVKAGDKDGEVASTYIVKGLKDGFQVFGLLGEARDEVKTTAGEFTPTS